MSITANAQLAMYDLLSDVVTSLTDGRLFDAHLYFERYLDHCEAYCLDPEPTARSFDQLVARFA